MKATNLDYLHGHIGQLFRKVFFPTLLGMVFNSLITIADGMFVGRGVGPEGIAAVNVIAPLYMVATGIGLMFGIGASVSAGIALANNDTGRASRIISAAFAFATMIMVAIICVALIMPTTIARVMGSSEALMPHTKGYLLYVAIGLLPLMWQSIGMMVIRLDGSPKYAMMCNVIPSVLNFVLDWIMVFPMGMGVRGAALASSIACGVGGIMALAYFRKSYVLKLTRRLNGFGGMVVVQAKIGSSAFITELAMSIMMFTGNFIFMRSFGENGVAAYAIACYLFPLIFMINNAVAQSAQPIISVNYGAGDAIRVKKALAVSLKVALVCGLIASLAIAFGAQFIVGLFISPVCEAGIIATHGLPIFSASALFFAMNIAFIGYYQSVERGGLALMLTLLRGVFFLVPSFFIMSALFPGWGMWGAIPVSEFVTLVVILGIFYNRKKRAARRRQREG